MCPKPLKGAVAPREASLGPFGRLQVRRIGHYYGGDYEGVYADALELTRLAPYSHEARLRLGYSALYLDRYAESAHILDSLARSPTGCATCSATACFLMRST